MELNKLINIGTFGRIYRSKDQKYVIKVDKDNDLIYAENEKKRLRIVQNHPNIVKMFDLDTFPSREGIEEEDLKKWWIVMEPAQDNLRNFDVYRLDVKSVAKQLFSGLAHIHHHKIIHGDLKLANILTFRDGKRVAICDFGNSQSFDQPRGGHDTLTTLWYRAPESLAWQSDWDEKIDVWGMGVIYYYLLQKMLVYNGQNERVCLKQICEMFGYLEFEHPPLLHEVEYWNMEGRIYKGESSSKLLRFEKEDKILDACLVPLPRYRKSAQEIVELFESTQVDSK